MVVVVVVVVVVRGRLDCHDHFIAQGLVSILMMAMITNIVRSDDEDEDDDDDDDDDDELTYRMP